MTYRLLMLLGIGVSAVFWLRLARGDRRLFWVYLGALLGAFAGAKAVYLLAEGWLDWQAPDRWLRLAAGKTVIGALLGGYAGVEMVKHAVGYRQATGDWFASVVPAAIALGRVGCWSAGCCLGHVCPRAWYTVADRAGVHRWPSVQLELGFNLLALVVFALLRVGGRLPGQHFHLYLIAYGVFRLLHETMRDTPRIFAGVTGYQVAALALVGLGVWGFERRRKSVRAPANAQGAQREKE
jgi:phosphatidylglycerol:prolipoprotein diacylglycerol transferase